MAEGASPGVERVSRGPGRSSVAPESAKLLKGAAILEKTPNAALLKELRNPNPKFLAAENAFARIIEIGCGRDIVEMAAQLHRDRMQGDADKLCNVAIMVFACKREYPGASGEAGQIALKIVRCMSGEEAARAGANMRGLIVASTKMFCANGYEKERIDIAAGILAEIYKRVKRMGSGSEQEGPARSLFVAVDNLKHGNDVEKAITELFMQKIKTERITIAGEVWEVPAA